MTKTEQLARLAEHWVRWQKDPIAFMTEVLDVQPEHVWSKMREVAESVRDNRLTAVGAGHSLSKTYLSARLALWFLYCFRPSTVVTTAPSYNQVADQFWRELRDAHAHARIPLGGKPITTALDLQSDTGRRWFATGISTRPDTVTAEATKFQGYHNKHVLIVFDEAAGVVPQIWKAAQHLLTGEGDTMRWLAQGNPASPTGDFAEALEPGSRWHRINVSCLETPNYIEGREVIPGVAGREYVEDVRRKYGEESNEWKIRILGQKPDFSEQTFFGRQLAAARANDQLGFYPHEPRAKVYTAWDIGSTHTAIWFAQFIKEHRRIIDFYYDSGGKGLPHYAALLQQKSKEQDYVYAQHFGPWDFGGGDARDKTGPNARNVQTGKYFVETAKQLGIPFTIIDRYSREAQWAAARDFIHNCLFNENTVQEGWDGLLNYRKKLNATLSTMEKPVYYDEPVRDWSEHVGSAFCTLAMAFYRHTFEKGLRLGGVRPRLAYAEPKEEEFNELTHGLMRSGV